MNILNLQGMTTDKVINPLGQLGVVSQQEKLTQDMETLLLTRKGSVIGNPKYGSNLHDFLFEPASEDTIKRIEQEIKQVLTTNYSSLSNLEVESKLDGNRLDIKVNYTTLNSDLSSAIEFTIPIDEQGGINYE